MANTRAGNVIKCDTTATFTDAKQICGIKYIGAASGTAVITDAGGSGNNLWVESGTTNQWNDAEIVANDGVTVTVTNSAIVYLYLEAD